MLRHDVLAAGVSLQAVDGHVVRALACNGADREISHGAQARRRLDHRAATFTAMDTVLRKDSKPRSELISIVCSAPRRDNNLLG